MKARRPSFAGSYVEPEWVCNQWSFDDYNESDRGEMKIEGESK